MDCSYCDNTRQIEMDNNGPIVPCPVCCPDKDETIIINISGAVTDDMVKDILIPGLQAEFNGKHK